MPGIARHTPALTGELISRVVVVDAALLSHVGDVLSRLTQSHNWVEMEDSVEAITIAAQDTLDSYYEGHMIGAIGHFLGQLSPGWIACDGSTLAQADYPELAGVLDAQYLDNVADTILLPDLRDVFILSSGATYPLGATGGSAAHALTVAELPAHSHEYLPPVVDIDLESPGAPDIAAARIGAPTQTGSAGSDQAHENMPPYHALIVAIFAGR